MKSAVTISLVEEARGGPFVLWDDFSRGCEIAKELGYDAVELFAPSPEHLSSTEIQRNLDQHRLQLAAVGTGAGMVIQGLSLTDADPDLRSKAIQFIKSMIDYGGPFKAPAIIGSMQGRFSSEVPQKTALQYLGEALDILGEYASQYETPLIYEPLNRYETNLVCRIEDGVSLLKKLSTTNVKLLADLFHMNIEEADLAEAILAGKGYIGHVHFVDSNREPAGGGHTNFVPIIEALKNINYQGYLSAEAFPIPDPHTAARQTITSYRKLVTS